MLEPSPITPQVLPSVGTIHTHLIHYSWLAKLVNYPYQELAEFFLVGILQQGSTTDTSGLNRPLRTPTMIGCRLWGPYLARHKVLFQCNNLSLVNKGYAKSQWVCNY